MGLGDLLGLGLPGGGALVVFLGVRVETDTFYQNTNFSLLLSDEGLNTQS